MTNEEAIKYAKNVDFCAGCWRSAYGIDGVCGSCELGPFFELVIEAIEKQIPKKPILDKYRCKCANDHNLPVQCRKGKMKYCPMCGQAIDWSEPNDD